VSSIDGACAAGEGFGREIGWASRLPLWAVVLRHPHPGALSAARGTFYTADPAHVVLLTLKTAEDGRGLVVRLLETEGRAAVARVGLPFATVTAATSVNAAEEPRPGTPPVAIDPDGHTLHIPVAPHDLVTVRLEIR
jgi:alpha-mannosidase